jgi:hypothetical protein
VLRKERLTVPSLRLGRILSYQDVLRYGQSVSVNASVFRVAKVVGSRTCHSRHGGLACLAVPKTRGTCGRMRMCMDGLFDRI